MYRVLLVDDEIINYQLFEKLVNWKEKGFEIVGTASDGQEALQQYELLEPDLIFMDIQLPLMDGLECVRCIRQENKDVQIVIVSAYGEFSYAQKAIRYGVQEFLLKPVSRIMLNQLVDKMKNVLDQEKQGNDGHDTARDLFHNEYADALTQLFDSEENIVSTALDKVNGKQVAAIAMADKNGHLFSENRCREIMNQIFTEKSLVEPVHGAAIYKNHVLLCLDEAIEVEAFADELLGRCDAQTYKSQIYMSDRKNQQSAAGLWQLMNCENYGFYDNKSCICKMEENPYVEQELSIQNVDQIISKAIVEDSYEEITAWMEERFAQAEKERIMPRILKDFSLDLLVRIKFILKKFDQRESFLLMRNVRIEDIHLIQDYEMLLNFMKEKIAATFTDLDTSIFKQGKSIVFRANAYAELHYKDVTFSVQDVAEYVGISKNYFTSQYKEQAQKGYWEYVTELRMKKAKEYLLTTEETVGNIAGNVGYESEYHFSRKFKEYYGEAPNRFRKKQ